MCYPKTNKLHKNPIANKKKREKIPESTQNIQSKFEVQIHKQNPSRENKVKYFANNLFLQLQQEYYQTFFNH